jgi:hypothetical protein
VVIDELHLVVRVSADLPAARVHAVRRVLADRRWVRRLGDAVRKAIRADPALAPCRVSIGR